MDSPSLRVTVTPKAITAVLAQTALLLVAAHILFQTIRFVTGDHSLFGLIFLFSIGSEANLPTFYSSLILVLAALLLALIGAGSLRDRALAAWYWFGLAALFGFLGVDEMLALHERLIEPGRRMFDTSGLLFYAWVIPYGLASLIFLAVYARFLLRLPRRTAGLFVAAGLLCVTGAIGFEMLGGWYAESNGTMRIGYVALQTVEEVLEITGVLVFIYALLDYIEGPLGGLRVLVPSRGNDARVGSAGKAARNLR